MNWVTPSAHTCPPQWAGFAWPERPYHSQERETLGFLITHQGVSDQDHVQEKEMQTSKMVVWGGLKIAKKRRGAKGKGKKERYTHLNAEFQRIARREKKAFLGDQCKEIEENNRWGKTRDLFKKIGDTKGICLGKMGSIKDRNGMDLTEAEDIKKRWQEYTEELYKKIFMTKITT